MINHIITINASTTASIWQVMLATGISMAFFLCLRSSEYVSRTIVPIKDTPQFLSTDVEFMLNDGTMRFVASNNIQAFDFHHFKVVKFSMLHAKKIYDKIMASPYGFPRWIRQGNQFHLSIWCIFGQSIPSGTLMILFSLFVVKRPSSKPMFGLNEAWFDTQSIRMSAPTIARAERRQLCIIVSGAVNSAKQYYLINCQQPKVVHSRGYLIVAILASRTLSPQPNVRRF